MSPTSLQTQEALHSARRKGYASPASVSGRQHLDSEILLNDGLSGGLSKGDGGLSEEQQEQIRFSQVGRDKDFVHVERIDGRAKNVIQGLELHTKVFNAEEQKRIVEYVYNLQHKGRKGQLRERTYSEPRKWRTCHNTIWLLLQLCHGDCIPPHIDHHDFLRPFCTVSFLTECNILFGSNLKVLSPGEFSGPVSIPLPVGSVLILNGNGADIAKHCVPAVPAKRISITFRKMDDSKLPYEFTPDPELMGIKPMVYSPLNKYRIQQNGHHKPLGYSPCANSSFQQNETLKKSNGNSFMVENDDFPPLGSNCSRFSRRESKQ
ncbi:hypothetical protein Dsin_032123 [Dipteronia sinensis]|uniref:Fe2OG dioxygenase domain-containing protein n=1 Tax=Dipteronia sinensis TaxID=43782 RepID=A0AAD9ZMZ3_9ROSI|nr:hypothetical protein Dsin_032123 [Dipteronia sinensis]